MQAAEVLSSGDSAPGLVGEEVDLVTSGKGWAEHLKTYYKVPQYIGAVIILGGLVVSVYPSLAGSGTPVLCLVHSVGFLIKPVVGSSGGDPLWEIVFFLATVPMAISAVYKQIAFESVDLDVWWLNGWVAVFQFVVGLTYAPLAAIMTDLPTEQIRPNIWHGLQCVFLGRNFITPDSPGGCSTALTCGTGIPCCDSCDGSIPTVSNSASRRRFASGLF